MFFMITKNIGHFYEYLIKYVVLRIVSTEK